jgi:hypothetical protein
MGSAIADDADVIVWLLTQPRSRGPYQLTGRTVLEARIRDQIDASVRATTATRAAAVASATGTLGSKGDRRGFYYAFAIGQHQTSRDQQTA